MTKIPSDWTLSLLNDCIEPERPICYGILKPGRGVPNGVPVIKVKNIKYGRILDHDLLLTSHEIDHAYRRSRLVAGDVLLSIRGTTGRTAMVPTHLDGANITQDTARISIRRSDNDSRFIYFALQSPNLQRQVSDNTKGQAVKGINIRDVRRLEVPVPPLREQRKIAAILSSVDEAIEKTQVVIDRAQVVKKGLMQELLTKGLPGRHKTFKQTEVGRIPESWSAVELGSLIVSGPTNGLYKPKSEYGSGVPIVRIDTFQ
ncbi:MAG: restriction endonuclease subunit S, partial [Myxococcota bacterium]